MNKPKNKILISKKYNEAKIVMLRELSNVKFLNFLLLMNSDEEIYFEIRPENETEYDNDIASIIIKDIYDGYILSFANTEVLIDFDEGDTFGFIKAAEEIIDWALRIVNKTVYAVACLSVSNKYQLTYKKENEEDLIKDYEKLDGGFDNKEVVINIIEFGNKKPREVIIQKN